MDSVDKSTEFWAALFPGRAMFCLVCDKTTKWIRLKCHVDYQGGGHMDSFKSICSEHQTLSGHEWMPDMAFEVDMTFGD